MQGTLQRLAGEVASFSSTVTFSHEHTFQEEGTISFDSTGHRLRFSTVGQGYLGASVDSTHQHGTVMWHVEGGEGQLAGASGLITSNFFVGADGAVADHHCGVIFLM